MARKQVNKTETEWLSGIKEIARYMRCDERKVRYWSYHCGLPIGTLPGGRKIMGKKSAIDAWMEANIHA